MCSFDSAQLGQLVTLTGYPQIQKRFSPGFVEGLKLMMCYMLDRTDPSPELGHVAYVGISLPRQHNAKTTKIF